MQWVNGSGPRAGVMAKESFGGGGCNNKGPVTRPRLDSQTE